MKRPLHAFSDLIIASAFFLLASSARLFILKCRDFFSRGLL